MNDNSTDLKFDGRQDPAIAGNYFGDVGRAIVAVSGQSDFAKIDAINDRIHASHNFKIYAVLFPGSIAAFFQLSMF